MHTSRSRSTGLALMGLGMLVFIGTNSHSLPAIAFWPALIAFLAGAVMFMRGNRVATEIAEKRAMQALNPKLGNKAGDQLATRQAQIDGTALADLGARDRPSKASVPIATEQLQEDEIVLYEVGAAEPTTGDEDFVVTTDVSYSVEMQEQGSLAEQLEKLQRLKTQGILSEEEFSIAKAKLLS